MSKRPRPACYWIYILQCDDDSYYTGYTKNVARRYRQHIDGSSGVRYTRTRRPVRIAQCWRLFSSVGTALKVESYIKRQSRPAKDRLVEWPDRLRPMASSALGLRLRLYTTNPVVVEGCARSLPPEAIKRGDDPFAGSPPGNL
jgi:putative endonuclease